MGSKQKRAPAKTQQTVINQLPAYLRPFVERALGRAEILSTDPYRPYTGPQLAEFSPFETMAHSGYEDLYRQGERPEMDFARQQAGYGGEQARYGAGQAQYGAGMAGRVGRQAGRVPMWDAQTAEQYMNPYAQNVMDIERRQALGSARQLMQQDAGDQFRGGTAGGSRGAVMQAMRESNLQQQLADIQSRGLDRSYGQAQQAFEADRAARHAGLGQMLQAGELGLQSGELGMGAGQLGLEAGQMGQGIAEMGQKQALARLMGLTEVGQAQRQMQQGGYDLAKRQFVAARDYPRQQMAFLMGAIRGVPQAGSDSTQTSQTPGPNPYGQAVGAGIGAVSLAKALGGI